MRQCAPAGALPFCNELLLRHSISYIITQLELDFIKEEIGPISLHSCESSDAIFLASQQHQLHNLQCVCVSFEQRQLILIYTEMCLGGLPEMSLDWFLQFSFFPNVQQKVHKPAAFSTAVNKQCSLVGLPPLVSPPSNQYFLFGGDIEKEWYLRLSFMANFPPYLFFYYTAAAHTFIYYFGWLQQCRGTESVGAAKNQALYFHIYLCTLTLHFFPKLIEHPYLYVSRNCPHSNGQVFQIVYTMEGHSRSSSVLVFAKVSLSPNQTCKPELKRVHPSDLFCYLTIA